jgi:purine-binding chemotaxis protein CheW
MQIIVFTLGEKYYAVNSEKVEEISKMIDSTFVPNAPHWIEGLINLRGNVVSLVNLCKLLQQDDDQCYNNIVITNGQEEKVGIMVNEVKEVLKVSEENIERVSTESSNGVSGIIQIEGQLVNYIDLDLIM